VTFRGTRLREAREARGLSVALLAQAANLAEISVRRLETGTQRPSAETLVSLADALRVPVAFFAADYAASQPMPIFYRSLTSVRKALGLRMAERRLTWAHGVISSLGEYVEMPPVTLPRFDAPSDPCDLSFAFVDRVADEARKAFGLGQGAISNVGWLLENHGCVIVRNSLGSDGIDAFSQYSADGRPLVFLGRHSSSVRHQFDYAHELGHLLLHRNIDKMHLRDVTRYRFVEDQAHRFASTFLLPEDSFRRSVGSRPTLNGLLALKSDWLVSVGAMVKRCETLGVISRDESRTLWISYLKRGWKKREPLDDDLAIAPPQMLSDAVAALRDADAPLFRRWVGEISDHVPPWDVAEITGTPEEWFRPNQIAQPRVAMRLQAM